MNKYTIKLLSTSMPLETYSTIEDSDVGHSFTLYEFLDWFKQMKRVHDYSEDHFHFIPIDDGTEMYRKGNGLTKVTKQEFNRALLTITMIQGD